MTKTEDRKMISISLKAYEKLKKRAEENHRTIKGELDYILFG